MIITIDGPVASGKSSVARAIAQRLGYYYLQTGLLYRAAAYLVIHKRLGLLSGSDTHSDLAFNQLKLPDQASIDAVMQVLVAQGPTSDELALIAQLDYGYDNYGYHDDVSRAGATEACATIKPGLSAGAIKPYVRLQDVDLTPHLSHHLLDQPASLISALPAVRLALLPVQRRIGERYDIVADGRDCGSVVFPHAEKKFYLTADRVVRAHRVAADAARKAAAVSFEVILAELDARDERDKNRLVAPLIVPEGAVVIDSSALTFEQTIDAFLRVIQGA